MPRITSLICLIFFTASWAIAPTFASEKQGNQGHHGMKHHTDKSHGNMKKKKGHHFSPHWAKTLSDEQKTALDRMHLELNSTLSVLKAQAELAQKELNTYTIRDNAKIATINTRIDKLLAVKKEILIKRYAHLREMREALTAEQRISYDMAILNRSGAK